DPLSLSMNLEANLFIDNAAFNQQLYDHLQDLAKSSCKPVTLERAKRGYWWRLPFIFLSFHFLRYFPAISGWLPAHSPELKPMRPEDFADAGKKDEWEEKKPEREKTV